MSNFNFLKDQLLLKKLDIDLRVTIVLVITLLLIGTCFYMLVEKWSLIDALYFCVLLWQLWVMEIFLLKHH